MGGIYIDRRFQMTNKTGKMLKAAMDAARTGGAILKSGFGTIRQDQIGLKGTGDFVSELDHQSEQAIIRHIKKEFPDHAILAEESGYGGASSSVQWCIDPLDGTTNYVQGIGHFSISIAVLEGKEILLGVVYDPMRDELFHAVPKEGAFLNGQQIRVSEKNDLSRALLTTGFPWRSRSHIDSYLSSFKELFLKSAGIRRMGSAAIDLSYTACGRFDGFWEMALKSWDISAGILIVKEAGGVVSDFGGGNTYMDSGNVVASNRKLHKEMIDLIRSHLSKI
jgi:myo-inositol-1(or 4)-monophosphatase